MSVSLPPEDLPDHDIHMDICWKKVTNYVCSQPLHGHRTTYTECCCQDGEAWSQQCALCPPRSSGVGACACGWEGVVPLSGAGPQCRECAHLGRGDLERSRAARAVTLPAVPVVGDKVGQAVG